MKRLILAAALIVGVPVSAQTITPQFTQGSYSATTTTSQTINETINQVVYGSEISTWSGSNVAPSAEIDNTTTTYSVVDSTQPWQLEITTRPAGIVETLDTVRTIQTDSTTIGLSVFSQ